jgi:carbonic anhydrase
LNQHLPIFYDFSKSVVYCLQKSDTDNKNFGKIIAGLEKIKNAGDTVDLPWRAMLCMKDVLESFRYQYYSGSLTSSPCSENVIWIVSKIRLKISSSQVCFFTHKLRVLTVAKNHILNKNGL